VHQSQTRVEKTPVCSMKVSTIASLPGFPHCALMLRAYEANHLSLIAIIRPTHPPSAAALQASGKSQISFVANILLPSVGRVPFN